MKHEPQLSPKRPVCLGIVEIFPIHYRAALYRELAQDPRLDLTVIYASNAGVATGDPQFGQDDKWDEDVLSGYRNVFLKGAGRTRLGANPLLVWNWDVIGHVKRGRFDVLWVHGYFHPTLQMAMLTQVASGRALLFREEQTLLEVRPFWKTALKQTWLRLVLSRAKGLYIGSENQKWLRGLGIGSSRLFPVPYCADNESLRRQAQDLRPVRSKLRAKFGLPPDGVPVFLTVARLVEKKQPRFLIDAYRRVRSQLDCALLIVGSGPLRADLEDYVRNEAIPGVTFAGFMNRSQIAEAYAVADVFVLASGHDETWGMVVNEAMNFALPVITTSKVGSSADLVKPQVNGFRVSPTDPGELADRLLELGRSEQTRVQMGRASATVIRDWSQELAAEGAQRAIASAVGDARWRDAGGTKRQR